MPLTIQKKVLNQSDALGLRILTGEIEFDSSYPTGGEAFDLSTEFSRIYFAAFEPEDGYTFRLNAAGKDDPSAAKVLAYQALKKFSAAVNPASLATDAVNSTAVTVTGVVSTDECVSVQAAAALEAGIVFQSARVTGTDTITVEVSNTSAGTVDAASATADFYVRKPSGAGYEVTDTTDLSTVTRVGFIIIGAK